MAAASPSPVTEVDTVATVMSAITLSGRFNPNLAIKPAVPGQAGAKVDLVTNLFQIKVMDETAHHYDITFKAADRKAVPSSSCGELGDAGPGSRVRAGPGTGDSDSGNFTRDLTVRNVVTALFEQLKQHDPDFHSVRAYFDGKKNMYTLNQMMASDTKEIVFDADVDGETRLVQAVYFYTGHSSDLKRGIESSPDELQALEIGLGYEPGRHMIQRGCKFFERSVRPFDMGLNLELRMGFVKSVRVTDSGLCVNLDRAAALFQKGGPLIDVFLKILSRTDARVADFRMNIFLAERLEKELSNMKFTFRHEKMKYTRTARLESHSITRQNVRELMFDYEKEGQVERISVYDYFVNELNVVLQYPNLPCIEVKSKGRKNFLPVEFCSLLPEQYSDKKMSDLIQKRVSQSTIQLPQIRYNQIRQSVDQLIPLAREMIDCEIQSEPVRVTGRVMNPPHMGYRNERDPKKEKVVIVNRSEEQFYKPGEFRQTGLFYASNPLKVWAIIQVQANSPKPKTSVHAKLLKFAALLSEIGHQRGFPISVDDGSFDRLVHNYQSFAELKKFVEEIIHKNSPHEKQLLLFVIPNDQIYNDIKKVSNEVGVVSQCLKLDVDNAHQMDMNVGTISRICGVPFVNNFLLKMNAKFGGINAKLAQESRPLVLKQKCMIVGMDVFHPGPGSRIEHSLAGIVASYTGCYTKYLQQAIAQPSNAKGFKRKEEITDAVYDAMLFFFDKWMEMNQRYPEVIIVFRDGVSEGQFDKVRIIELDQIYRAMDARAVTAVVTFITVQKRHNVRLFHEDKMGRVTNPHPGTVVDTAIVHPVRFEFYINSHYSLKGTSKPCHYCVLHNECGLAPDVMQQLAYFLCYLCARVNKPISIPVPVKYAHLVAEQASKSLESAIRNNLPGSVNEWIRVNDKFVNTLTYA